MKYRTLSWHHTSPLLLVLAWIAGLLLTPSQAATIDVIHVVTPVAQGKSMNCWAAATTMLVSWKRKQNLSMEEVVAEAGEKYKKIYEANTGINETDEKNLYPKFGLQTINGQNLTIQAWADLLVNHGPLSVTVDAKPPQSLIHALVVCGMKGDGSADDTQVTYIDPDGGKLQTISFSKFLKLYEGSAKWPLQIVHW